ncbi:MAG: asparaginase [Clostridia bacterium]|nr:asparaginase [Clostridia bacterium]
MKNESRKILILTTGGTIASSQTGQGLAPTLTPEELLECLPKLNGNITTDTLEICSIDSTDMTYRQWLKIADAIEKNYGDYDGFVISHGTDTMAYTAAALSYLIQNSEKPIVLTGAQKPIKSDITDAKTNMTDSLIYAADEKSRGVCIVFDGQVIAGTRAKKTKSFSYHAFSSINFPELAVIQDRQVIRYIEPFPYTGNVRFYHSLNPKVFLLKLTPGMEPFVLEPIFSIYDCIIVESFGVGGIPESLMEEFCRQLEKYKAGEKIVIMTTQVTYEGSRLGLYEVGSRFRDRFRFLEACDMTLEAAFAKIMWIMGMGNPDWDTIEKMFYDRTEYDIYRLVKK